MIQRRSLLTAAGAAGLARPALAGAAKTLTFVPQANLNSIDPVWNAAMVTRNMSAMVYETLYGRDEFMQPHPQMVEGDLMEDGGRRWTLRLRDGLRFHDGEKVLARDCTASLRRWARRDPGGTSLFARMDALETPDDRTIVFRLNKPFPHLRKLLSRFNTPAVIVPERLAQTDPFKQLPEAIGSGPFRWLASEQVIGSHAAFIRNDAYVPRDDKPSYMAGGRRVLLDRVEWKMIPDPSTAANALVTGEVDWVEIPLPDLLPMLRRTPGVTTGLLDPYGSMASVRLNHLHAPADRLGVRRAMLAAIDQREVMTAIFGSDTSLWFAPIGFFNSGNAAVDGVGMEAVRTRPSAAQARAMLKEAGYTNEPVVLLHAADHNLYNPAGTVVGDAFRAIGLNVVDQSMDWGTVMQRRVSKEPTDKGGWSAFATAAPAAEYLDPLLATFLRTSGTEAFYGWPSDARIEALFSEWLDTADEAAQVRVQQEWQQRAFDMVIHVPLGRYVLPSAWRSTLSGLLRGPAVVFWNVEKA